MPITNSLSIDGRYRKPIPMTLAAIREARTAKVTEARTLLASMPTLTPEAQTKFDAIKAEIVSLEGQEGRAVFLEDAERRAMGTPVGDKLSLIHISEPTRPY